MAHKRRQRTTKKTTGFTKSKVKKTLNKFRFRSKKDAILKAKPKIVGKSVRKIPNRKPTFRTKVKRTISSVTKRLRGKRTISSVTKRLRGKRKASRS